MSCENPTFPAEAGGLAGEQRSHAGLCRSLCAVFWSIWIDAMNSHCVTGIKDKHA